MSELNGIVAGVSEAVYFAHDSLSSTGARAILDSPARFAYQQKVPRAPKAEFDLGSAVHSKLLGTGYEIVTVPDEYLASNGALSTKAAKQFVDEARAEGRIPVKSATALEVDLIAESVLAHPTARALLQQAGIREASVFATDPETGVRVRARFDLLPDMLNGRRVAVDLKSGRDASPEGFTRAVADYGYDVQDVWYMDALRWAEGGDEAAMVFVVVETEPPYLTAVHQLPTVWLEMGREKARRARQVYAECVESGVWPGYGDEVHLLSPPQWLIFQHEEKFGNYEGGEIEL